MKGSNSNPSSPGTTSGSAVALPAARLQQQLIRQIERDTFCAADALAELSIHARDIRQAATSPEQRVLAFVLEKSLRLLADDQYGRAVNVSETDGLKRLFHDPITNSAAYFAEKGGNPVVIADSLIKALAVALPPPA